MFKLYSIYQTLMLSISNAEVISCLKPRPFLVGKALLCELICIPKDDWLVFYDVKTLDSRDF